MSADHIVILILVLALTVKFVFFDLINRYQPEDSEHTYTSKLVSLALFIFVNMQDLLPVSWYF
jgi:hypothetical protein